MSIPRAIARRIVSGDCTLCWVGDSTGNDGSSDSNLPFGIQQSWRPKAWVMRGGRSGSGADPWAVHPQITIFPEEFTRNQRVPGATFTAGQTAISPVGAEDLGYYADFGIPDEWHPWQFKLNDLAGYAVGDRFGGQACKARMIYWRDATGAEMKVRPRRGDTEIGAYANVSMAGAAGIAAVDVDCGSGAGAPGLYMGKNGSDQSGKQVYLLGCTAYRVDGAGNKLPGFGLTQVAEGGWNTDDHVDPALCTDANLAGFLAANHSPNTFAIMILNSTFDEGVQLAVGQYAVLKANLLEVIARYRAQALAAGADGPIHFLLINPYSSTGVNATIATARLRAMQEIKAADPDVGVIDLYTLAGSTAGDLTDGVHPSEAGATRLAGLLWGPIERAAGSGLTSVRLSRARRRAL